MSKPPKLRSTTGYRLSEPMYKFCNELLLHGDKKKALKNSGYSANSANHATRLLKRADVKKFLDSRRRAIAKKFDVSFDRKVNKLGMLVELAVPDDAQSIKDVNANAAIQAIGELNRMFGHYAPEKHTNFNLNINDDKAVELVQQTIKKINEYRSEY